MGKRESLQGKNEPKKIHQLSLSINDPPTAVPQDDEYERRLQMLKTFRSTPKEEEEINLLISNLKVLFEQRPVWLKHSLAAELVSRGVKYNSDFALKKALACTSYLFKNGPWKFTYVRFGYDPRFDREKSMIWQTFNVGIGNKNFLGDNRQNEE